MAKRSKKRESTRRINVPMTIAIVLFYLTLVSIYLTSGLYAKYTTRSSGQDGARVIKFGEIVLTETGDFVTHTAQGQHRFIIIPGVHLDKDVKVSFGGSEADTYVFVVVETPGWSTQDHKRFVVNDGDIYWNVNVDGEKEWIHLPTTEDYHVYYRYVKANQKLENVPVMKELGEIEGKDRTEEIFVSDKSNHIEVSSKYSSFHGQTMGSIFDAVDSYIKTLMNSGELAFIDFDSWEYEYALKLGAKYS